jgi:ABC-type multidrug transport system fused ATPase/permease subunit
MFARAVVGRPCVLILDDSFAELEECQRVELLNAIYNQKCWTIIDISHDAEQLKRADTIVVLSEGTVVEQGSPVMLASQNKYFSALFPELSRELQK